jgi:predicted RNA-binding Zn-ribbon protein involved in translation (DUF1610 family)
LYQYLPARQLLAEINPRSLIIRLMEKVGYCRKCGFELTEDSNFCPMCSANLKTQEQQNVSAEKKCPKCGTVMRVGFIVEKDSPLSLMTLASGIYWTPGEAGVMGERVGLKAYACPQCGYIEHYVRNLGNDRQTILGARPE